MEADKFDLKEPDKFLRKAQWGQKSGCGEETHQSLTLKNSHLLVLDKRIEVNYNFLDSLFGEASHTLPDGLGRSGRCRGHTHQDDRPSSEQRDSACYAATCAGGGATADQESVDIADQGMAGFGEGPSDLSRQERSEVQTAMVSGVNVSGQASYQTVQVCLQQSGHIHEASHHGQEPVRLRERSCEDREAAYASNSSRVGPLSFLDCLVGGLTAEEGGIGINMSQTAFENKFQQILAEYKSDILPLIVKEYDRLTPSEKTMMSLAKEQECKMDGKSVEFRTFLTSRGEFDNVPLSLSSRNRMNSLFHNCAGVYSICEDMVEFTSGYVDESSILAAVAAVLEVQQFKAGCRSLGLISKIIIDPLWRVLTSNRNVLAMEVRYQILVTKLKEWQEDGRHLVEGNECLFDDIEVHKDLVFCRLTMWTEPDFFQLTVQIVELLLDSFLKVCCKVLPVNLEPSDMINRVESESNMDVHCGFFFCTIEHL
ncbi:unnamed protein product [Coregonus sp. 'balchen']|nr:unnamed protein product [Coregonus sp. 'balchen']